VFSGFVNQRRSQSNVLFAQGQEKSCRNLKWIQKHNPQMMPSKRKKISEHMADETLLKFGSEYFWLWVAVEPKNRRILALYIPKERDMPMVERFLSGLVGVHGKHPISTDCGTRYPMACGFLKPKHHIHPSFEKSLVERTMQYIRIEPNALMTTFHAEKRTANQSMYGTG
jgi:putative transposase